MGRSHTIRPNFDLNNMNDIIIFCLVIVALAWMPFGAWYFNKKGGI
jgi:branched-subunit amino acid ABC-type transport system permease component